MEMKVSQMGTCTEWIVKQSTFGEPREDVRGSVSFQRGQMDERLGNLYPTINYHYLVGAIVTRQKGK